MNHRMFAVVRRLCALAALAVFALPGTGHAETITAALSFVDGDGTPAPIVSADVEIWRLDAPFWNFQRTVTTDAVGRFTATVPFVGGNTYALRVFATNPAAQVYTQDVPTAPFYRQPGLPGPELLRTSTAASDVLDFSFTFSDAWATNHFNVADAILRGKRYADLRRDPRETDTIARVAVLMNSVSTFYDPISHLLRIQPVFAMDDFTLLHEYAHYLEERISSFFGIASFHDGCQALIGATHVEEPGLAWMEGFADYFAQAVARAFPGEVDGPGLGTLSAARLETPTCPASSVPLDAREVVVAGALFDIIDTANEFGDQLCSATTMQSLDTVIFQIFDHELDLGWTNPNIQLFANAWVARGLDLPPLLSTFGTSGLAVTTPAPAINYDALLPANLAVWRPGPGAQWHVLGGASAPASWGTWGDVPVPGDYDGDGLTDVAVWRPSTGRWFVLLSASGGVAQEVQWGSPGDIPLPGDYDGDREIDFAVYRPSEGNLYIHNDSCGPPRVIAIGSGTPVVGDFDGDGIDDPGVYDASNGWFQLHTAAGVVWRQVGKGGGTPVVADFDGDARADLAVYRPATGNWDIRSSFTGLITTSWWGEAGDVPVPADYDGDGRADLATWNTVTGTWWIHEADGPQWSVSWGIAGDVPVPAP